MHNRNYMTMKTKQLFRKLQLRRLSKYFDFISPFTYNLHPDLMFRVHIRNIITQPQNEFHAKG